MRVRIKPAVLAIVASLAVCSSVLGGLFGVEGGFLAQVDKAVVDAPIENLTVFYFPDGLSDSGSSPNTPIVDSEFVALLVESPHIEQVVYEARVGNVPTCSVTYEDGRELVTSQGFTIWSVSLDYAAVKGLELADGRWLFEEGADNECVVGANAAARLNVRPGSRIGPQEGLDESLAVCGVLRETQASDAQTNQLNDTVLVRYPFMPAITLYHQNPNGGCLVIEPVFGETEGATEDIHVAAATASPTGIARIRSGGKQRSVYTRIGSNYAGAYAGVATVALVVANVGLAAMLLAQGAVEARIIGIRRAIGLTRLAVQRDYLIRGASVVASGLLLGLVLAVPVFPWLSSLTGSPMQLSSESSVMVSFTVLATGLLASYLPALATASIDPVTAIRDPNAVPSLRPRVLRVLAVVSVVIAVVSVSVVGAIGGALRDRIDRYMLAAGENVVVIQDPDPFSPSGGKKVDARLLAQLDGTPGIQSACYQVSGQFAVTSVDGTPTVLYGVGSTSDFFAVERLSLDVGRVLSDDDREACVVGPVAARKLFGRGDAVGQTLTIGPTSYKVVGLLEDHLSDLSDGSWLPDWSVIVPASQESTFPFIPGNRHHQVSIEFVDDAALAAGEPELRAAVAALGFDVDTQVTRPLVEVGAMRDVRVGQERAFLVFAGLSGLMAITNLANYMFVHVRARRREIAIRRAIGCSRGTIAALLIKEALSLCSLGGLMALLVSTAAVVMVCGSQSAGVVSHVRAGAISFGAASIMALAGTLLPAFQASRLDPAEALGRGE